MLNDSISSLAELPRRAAEAFGLRTAISTASGSLSFVELDRVTATFARKLAQMKVRPGDRVALFGENCLEWIIAYYGISRAGAAAVPVNPRRSQAELEAVLGECGVRTLIASGNLLKAAALPAGLNVISWGGATRPDTHQPFEQLLETNSLFNQQDPIGSGTEEVICYTSGTTGRHKAVRLSHRSLLLSAAMLALMHARSSDDIVVSAMSCANVYGAAILNSALMVGARLVLLSEFAADQVLACLEEQQATMLDGVPTMYMELLKVLRERGCGPGAMRLCALGGAPVSPATLAELEERLGCPLVEIWGMTEIAGIGTTRPYRGPAAHGSIGVPIPYLETRISPLHYPGDGEARHAVGELLVRGQVLMTGYLNADLTRSAFEDGGWFRTGDLVRQAPTGELEFVDRRADIIELADGYVFPAEVERIVCELPGVALAAVALDEEADPAWNGQVYVVQAAGATITGEEILAYCQRKLPANSQPRTVEFREILPLTGTGKVWRRGFRDSAAPKS